MFPASDKMSLQTHHMSEAIGIRQLASRKIITDLQKCIEEGKWNPGEKLPSLTILAKDFSVGVSTLRESLRVLENQGYIMIEHGRGVFVRSKTDWKGDVFKELTDIPEGDLISLMEFRLVLEPEMAAFAAERGSPGQISKIKEAAQKMQEKVLKGEDYFEEDIGFHDYIADASQNPVMRNVFQGISNLLFESRRKTNLLKGSVEKAVHFHMLIAVAIEQRNSDLARSLMKMHLKDVAADLVNAK